MSDRPAIMGERPASECRTPGCCSCPGMQHCPSCGYTEHDKAILMDHRYCPEDRAGAPDRERATQVATHREKGTK